MKITVGAQLGFLGALLVSTLPAHAQELAEWRHYRPVYLDTTAAGGGFSGDVANFPVAVVLDARNFDFRQAQSDGSDLRFSMTRDAQALPHHIELWDGAARRALVWVKVPLVPGNSKSRIFLHWGNPDAPVSADSRAVFDPAAGFIGVWHLNENGAGRDGGFQDSTATAAHAKGVNLAPEARADGRLGKGIALSHASGQWIKLDGEKKGHFDLTNKLTFSIWAKARSYSNKGNPDRRWLPGYETMFAKGDNSWRLQKFGIRSWHKPAADLVEICVERKNPKADLCVVGTTDMAVDKWYHFHGVHDHPNVKLYVNGVLEKVETFDSEWTSGEHPVGIGNQSQFPEQGRSWDGVLDEARLLGVVKDDHWIKLDYESQREGQKVVTLGPPQRR